MKIAHIKSYRMEFESTRPTCKSDVAIICLNRVYETIAFNRKAKRKRWKQKEKFHFSHYNSHAILDVIAAVIVYIEASVV